MGDKNMKRIILVIAVCFILLVSYITMHDNEESKSLQGTNAAINVASGMLVFPNLNGNDQRQIVSGNKKEVKNKTIIFKDANGKKQKMKIGNVNTKDKGERIGGMNSSAEYSQVLDGHYYYVRKKDVNLYTLYQDKGEEVVDFSKKETKPLGVFSGVSPNMIFYHNKLYSYPRLYLDKGALLEIKNVAGNRLELFSLTERDSYLLDGDISGDCIVDGSLYFSEMGEGKKLQFYQLHLESGKEEKILEYKPKKEKPLGKCWGGAMQMDHEGIFFQEYWEKGDMIYFLPWSGNEIQKITPKAVTAYAYNSQYVFYMDKSFRIHRWNRGTKKPGITGTRATTEAGERAGTGPRTKNTKIC